jgi:hypothetical protein
MVHWLPLIAAKSPLATNAPEHSGFTDFGEEFPDTQCTTSKLRQCTASLRADQATENQLRAWVALQAAINDGGCSMCGTQRRGCLRWRSRREWSGMRGERGQGNSYGPNPRPVLCPLASQPSARKLRSPAMRGGSVEDGADYGGLPVSGGETGARSRVHTPTNNCGSEHARGRSAGPTRQHVCLVNGPRGVWFGWAEKRLGPGSLFQFLFHFPFYFLLLFSSILFPIQISIPL